MLRKWTGRAALIIAALGGVLAGGALADPHPPAWGGGTGAAVHFQPAPWPTDPADIKDCGISCGTWKPYTRFQGEINDPRVQDPSNGGTAPQNYVNISSSCIDKSYPSIYYYLHKDPVDPAKDVIMFRWRVEQIANNYATGPAAGNFGATDPWSSGLWTVLFDVDGDGYRDLAAHLNGSSGDPSHAIDQVAGVWGSIPTQSVDYLTDPNIHLLGHNPTAFTEGNTILNFHDSLTPNTSWPNGANETVWDYGTTRAKRVFTNSCNEYFVDYQIPVAMLDASGLGGPKLTRTTPISMLFCTANSLNNPFQKDCALNRSYIGNAAKPAPFGDYLSFNKDEPYAQPIISSVTATAPASCGSGYDLVAKVQDTLYVNDAGVIEPSVQSVAFYYWYDADGDGTANDAGSAWTLAATGTRKPNTLNTWTATWISDSLAKGKYLIGVQAVDNKALHDDGVLDAPVNNRTFSYYVGSTDAATQARIYANGWTFDGTSKLWVQTGTPGWLTGQQAAFEAQGHASAMTPGTGEDWYGNPDATGLQIATAGVDLAINTCGVAPTLQKTVSDANPAANGVVDFTLTLTNGLASALSLTQISDPLPTGFTFHSNQGGSLSPAASPSSGDSGPLLWTFAPGTTIGAGASATLVFRANVTGVAGNYSNTATAETGFGSISSDPVALAVDAARISLTKTPSVYKVSPGGTISYDLAYANDSTVTVTAAQISDVLPAGLAYSSCTGGDSCGFSGGTVTWNLGNLAGGASGTVTLVGTVDSGYGTPSLTNTATLDVVAPDGTTHVQKTASSTIAVNVPQPAFTLTKTASALQAAPGGSVTWTIAYKNYGTGDASGVVIADRLPDGFTYSGSTGGGVHSNGTVTWNIGTVAKNVSGTVTVTAIAAAAPFTYTNPAVNNATITWTGNATGVSASNSVGVTGQACNAMYYFNTDLTADGIAPTQADTGTSTVLNTGSAPTVVFTTVASPRQVVLDGKELAVRFYIDPAVGNLSLATQVERVYANNTTAPVTTYTQTGLPNSAGWYGFSFPFTGGTSDLMVGERLRFTFTVSNGTNKNLTLYYDGYSAAKSVLANSHASVCSATAPAALTLSKTVDQPNIASASGTLNYVLAYANVGGSTATGVNLVDTLPANVSCSQTTNNCSDWANVPASCSAWTSCSGGSVALLTGATLAANASGHFAVQATVGGGASGTLTNSATLSATGVDPATATAATIVGSLSGGGGSPALSLVKTASSTLLSAGEAVDYELTLVNVGTGTASNVTVADTIPANGYFKYVASSIAGGDSRSVSGNDLSWTINTLAVGDTVTLSFRMAVDATGVPVGVTSLDNFATAADGSYCTSAAVSGCTSNTVTVAVSGNPNLVLGKTALPTSGVVPGDTIDYTVTVSNTGSAAASGVVISDPIPANTKFKAISGAGSFDAVNNRVVLDVGTLAAGAGASLTFSVTALTPLPNGATSLVNTATVTAANAAARLASATSTASASPAPTLTKSGPASAPFPAAQLSADVAGANVISVSSAAALAVGQLVRVGSDVARVTAIAGKTITLSGNVNGTAGDNVLAAITYALNYGNGGNATATGVVLQDTLPAGMAYAEATPAPDTVAGGTLTWNLGSLAPQASGAVQVVAFPTAVGTHVNAATLASNESPTQSANASTKVGGLVVSKTTSTPIRSAGGIAAYDITLTNSLNSAVADVTVTDSLANGFTYRTGSATVGGVASEPSFGGDDAAHAQPSWSGLTVPAAGSLVIHFEADIGAGVGAATYQNMVTAATSTAGVGILQFDALGTTAEDVTVLGAGSGLLDGHVYRDADGSLSFGPAGDVPLTGVKVTVEQNAGDCAVPSSTTCYVIHTDSDGYFTRTLPAGNWRVVVDTASGDLGGSGLSLVAGSDPATVSVPSLGQASHDVGYASPIPDMTVSLTLPAYATSGGTVTGTLTCTNAGGVAASNATCAVSGATLSACVQNPGATPLATPVSVASLAAGGSVSCTVTATAPANGTLTVTASTGASDDGNAANNDDSADVAIIDAVDDGSSVLIQSASGTTSYSLLTNDTVGGLVATVGGSGNVGQTITAVTKDAGAIANPFSLNAATGELVVPNTTAVGTYVVTYRICAAAMPAVCDTASKTVVVQASAPATSLLAGTVFHDVDASRVQNGAEVGTNAGGINVVIVDAGNQVLAVAAVAVNGTWSASVVSGSGYRAYVSTANPSIGATVAPAAALPAGWLVTGENVAGVADGSADGILAAINATTDVAGLNFGIRQPPDMRVSLTGFPATAAPNSPLSGTLTCTNQGSGAAVAATCAVVSGGVVTGCTPAVPVASLAVGASIVCTVTATAPASGSLVIHVMTGAGNDTGTTGKTDNQAVAVAAAVPGAANPIPTLSQWGVLLLSLLLAGAAWRSRRRA